MTQWSESYVRVNDINIHYHRTGGDKPPVLLLHGFTDNGLCWLRTARVLERDYDVIMTDARGHGLSDKPGRTSNPLQLADDAAGVIRELALSKPHILGHSMGARTAADVAVAYPELVRTVLLEDPAWFDNPSTMSTDIKEQRAPRMEQWRERVIKNRSLSRKERLALVRAENPAWAEEDVEPWVDAQMQFDLSLFDAPSSALPNPSQQKSWREIAQNISCPALLITGDPERGAIVTPQIAQEAARIAPDLQVVHLAGAGHNIRRERYDGFIEAVTTFLKQH